MSNSRVNTIANNTLFLYLRSFIVMAISIYTSRILLDTLGIDDYGLYNLVAGVVAMFNSLRTVFASSIQRFLNYEKGKGHFERVRMVFSQSLIVQGLLGVLFAVLVELFGYWFISNRLTIPESSMDIALFVFHCSVITAVLTILTTPFDAAIIANEKIRVFAWLSMFDSCLKLIIVYFLPILGFQYLCSYALMMLGIGVINILFNTWYCHRFSECKFSFCWDKNMMLQLSSFAGWNFLGNTAFALVNEGINMLLNIFGGVAVNAARGIAYQVKSSISTLCNNLFVAAQPFVVQQAASQEREIIFRYIFRLSRLMFLIVLCTVFPVIVYCEEILDLWLVETPYLSVIFVQLVLIHLVQRSLHSPIDLLFKSYGEIRNYQILDSLSLALSLPLGYCVLEWGWPLYSVFIVVCMVEVLNIVLISFWAHQKLGMGMKAYFKDVIGYCLGVLVFFLIVGIFFLNFIQPSSVLELLVYFLIVGIVEIISIYFFLLCKEDKIFIQKFILSKFRKK